MEAVGIVTHVDNYMATVKSERSSACSSCYNCEAKGACHVELVFGDQNAEVSVKAYNKIGAKTGDKVLLESPTGRTLFASVVTFVIPVILSVASYLALSNYFTQAITAVITLVALAASFLLTSRLMNLYSARFLKPSIIEIIEESEIDIEGK